MPYQASWSKRYVNNEIKNHEKNINQVHPVQNVCSSCTTPMYINIMQCAKRYHPWNVSIICLYQYANHVHLPTCQTMYHITRDMTPSWTKCHNHVSQTNANCCANQVVPMVARRGVDRLASLCKWQELCKMEVSRSILTPLYPEGVLAGCAFLPRGYKAAGRIRPRVTWVRY